jgi:hypothetical protein
MDELSPAQITELIKIQKDLSIVGFERGFQRIEELSQSLPVVPREQYRLFLGFCLFKLHQAKARVKTTRLPPQILRYHDRLLADVSNLSVGEIRERWTQFRSPKFVSALEAVAHGHPDLTAVVSIVKSNPTGKAFLDLLNENRGKTFGDLNPKFLAFLHPSPFSGNLPMITDREYEQIRLLPRK